MYVSRTDFRELRLQESYRGGDCLGIHYGRLRAGIAVLDLPNRVNHQPWSQDSGAGRVLKIWIHSWEPSPAHGVGQGTFPLARHNLRPSPFPGSRAHSWHRMQTRSASRIQNPSRPPVNGRTGPNTWLVGPTMGWGLVRSKILILCNRKR